MRYFHYTFAIKLLGSLFLISFSLICFSATFDMDVSGSDHNNGSMNRSWKTLTHLNFNESTPGDILAVGVRLEGAKIAASGINSKYVAAGSINGVICLHSSSCDKQTLSYHTLSGTNYTDGGNSRIFFRGIAKEWEAEPISNASGISFNKYAFYSGALRVQLISVKSLMPKSQSNNLIFSNF